MKVSLFSSVESFVHYVASIHLAIIITALFVNPSEGFAIFFFTLDLIVSAIFAAHAFAVAKTHGSKATTFMNGFAAIPFVVLFGWTPLSTVLNIFKVMMGLKSIIALYESARKKDVNDLVKVLIAFLIVLVYFSLAIVQVERTVNRDIGSLSDGLWLALTTVTSVGYGDITPTTPLGKITAGLLMIFGIGLSSALGALFVSYLLKPTELKILATERRIEREEEHSDYTESQLLSLTKKISKRLDAIEKKLSKK